MANQREETHEFDASRALQSLAVLKSSLDFGRDYLDNFCKLVLPVVASFDGEPLSSRSVADEFFKNYSLRVPDKTIELVLRRLAKRKVLTKQAGSYYCAESVDADDLQEMFRSAQGANETLYANLMEFCQERFGLSISRDDIALQFTKFVSRFGVDFLKNYIFRSTLPDLPDGLSDGQFAIAAYVRSVSEDGGDQYTSVMSLVQAHMYANALLCPDLESIEKDFSKVTFYFDTPCLVPLVVQPDPIESRASNELLALIQGLRGKVAVFAHTFEELNSVLQGVLSNLENPRAEGALVRDLRRAHLKAGDVAMRVAGAEQRLNELGFSIQPTPEYVQSYQIDESKLEAAFDECGLHYKHERAKDHDVNSIRSIYVIRKAKKYARLEDSLAVLVTNNAALARSAQKFGRLHEGQEALTSVVTDYALANVAWLKRPASKSTMPERELLAASVALMEPSEKFWRHFLKSVDEIERSGKYDPDILAVLRATPLAERELMELTLGSEDLLTDSRIDAVVERVKARLRDESASIVDSERIARERAEAEADELRLGRARQEARAAGFASNIGGLIEFLIRGVHAAGVLASGMVALIFGSSGIPWTWQAMTLALFPALLTALDALGVGVIRHLKRSRRNFEQRLTTWILGP
ncbi:MAG: hypothetical protein GC200_12185 [Tepidisphaera sp.]|nr:hypothetical protein [Tepidisphaera sp.]